MSFGYFGKLPSRGDFLAKGLPETMLAPLDEWLRQGLDVARRQFGDKWHDIYLTSPAWRFSLSAGIAGPTAAAGVMVPSTDRSHRDFPFVIACRVAPDYGPAQLAACLSGWLDAAAELAVVAVNRELDPAALDQRMGALGPPPPPPLPGRTRQWRLEGIGDPATALPVLLDQAVSSSMSRPSFWWSEGADPASSTSLMQDGWPTTAQLCSMLSGSWG